MKSYYVLQNEKDIGPFSVYELKAGKIYSDTKIKIAGEEDWKCADEIPELLHIISQGSEFDRPEDKKFKNKTETKEITSFGYEHASLLQRFLAALVNGTCISIITTLLVKILSFNSAEVSLNSTFEELLNYEIQYTIENVIVIVIISLIVYPRFCGNIGHKVLNLKVISSKDGGDYDDRINGVKRQVLKKILGFLIIPCIWLLFSPKRQNLYERIVHTYVVKAK